MRPFLTLLLLRDSSYWKATPRRRTARLMVIAAYVYLGVLLLLLFLENRLLYAGTVLPKGPRVPPPELNARAVTLAGPHGETLQAWLSAPPGWRPEQGAMLFSHGNGSNVATCAGLLQLWCRAVPRAFLIYSYPGYGWSTGKPSEAGCLAAAEAAYRYLVEELKVPGKEVILIGDSLGAAMATDLASRHDARLLVTVNAFTSFPDMAQLKFPWLPARWLVSTQFHNLRKIAQVKCPVFITHGTADGLVPYWMSERLFTAAPSPKHFYPREGAGHFHPIEEPFFAAVRDFLARTEKR